MDLLKVQVICEGFKLSLLWGSPGGFKWSLMSLYGSSLVPLVVSFRRVWGSEAMSALKGVIEPYEGFLWSMMTF